MSWNIYYNGKWVSENDMMGVSEITDEESRAYLPITAVLDIEPDEVDEITVERKENSQVYTVNFNKKFRTASERFGSSKREKFEREAIATYTVNDFGVMTGYELKLIRHEDNLPQPIVVSTKYNLLNVNKEEIDGEIRELVNGNFQSYDKAKND